MSRSSFRFSRREFLEASVAGALVPAIAQRGVPPRESLYNGLLLPTPWPPDRVELDDPLREPYYLADPPASIDVDVGRQLFVDDFLIQESSLRRVWHPAVYHAGNPVLAPERPWEHEDPYAATTNTPPSPSAMPFSDGVFYDARDRVFKLWYMAGYQQHTALALSSDGVAWERPTLDVVRGTNIVFSRRRDSATIWVDREARDPSARYKMAVYLLEGRALRLFTSPDGVHWREGGLPGPAGDRSTMFFNPFRRVWVFSLRAEEVSGLHRYRRYVERRDFASARWTERDAVLWTGADSQDVLRPDVGTQPELYNLDAVAYESVLLGLFTMYRGERPNREKPNDICIGFSRDGFHWHRPWREPFIGVSDREGDWNWANVQSAGGGCLVVGDRLHFYVSGRSGVAGTSFPGTCSTGLATLRRDGFASLTDAWPAGTPRLLGVPPGTMTTRPLRFNGRHLFVNADVAGELRVEVLDEAGRVVRPFTQEACVAVHGNSTRHRVRWKEPPSLAELRGERIRLRFHLSRAHLYAFWLSASERGESGGYVAAGGPGFTGTRDI